MSTETIAPVVPVAEVINQYGLTLTECKLISTALTQQVAYNGRQAERFGPGPDAFFHAQADMSKGIIAKLGQVYTPRATRERK